MSKVTRRPPRVFEKAQCHSETVKVVKEQLKLPRDIQGHSKTRKGVRRHSGISLEVKSNRGTQLNSRTLKVIHRIPNCYKGLLRGVKLYQRTFKDIQGRPRTLTFGTSKDINLGVSCWRFKNTRRTPSWIKNIRGYSRHQFGLGLYFEELNCTKGHSRTYKDRYF